MSRAAFKKHDRLRLAGSPDDTPDWIRQLILAADGFIVDRSTPDHPDGKTIIAGYPWFGDWGRDTFVALPGLTLAVGCPEIARQILTAYIEYIDHGMLPNNFPDTGVGPQYDSVDAALWYIEAWREYLHQTRDIKLLRQVFPSLERIIECYRKGTRFGIEMDPNDGLLKAGKPGDSVTWMDARVDEEAVTPRIGKPVEVNALWFNALSTMACFATHFSQTGEPYQSMANRVQAGFQRFIRGDGEGLFDVLDGPEGNDSSIRPNQILSVSLCHSPLERTHQSQVLDCCTEHLLCDYGLRSLAPGEVQYRGECQGDVRSRDSSYHQGTVWGWLLGHYVLAHYRVNADAGTALHFLKSIRQHMLDAGVGSVSEIFDGDEPHWPRGAPSQAWSVACILQAWWKLTRVSDRSYY